MTTDPSYEFVCQAAHLFFAAFVMLASTRIFGATDRVVEVTAAIGAIAAAVKEFWYDLHFESPETSGGFYGSNRDFAFYLLGLLVSDGILMVTR